MSDSAAPRPDPIRSPAEAEGAAAFQQAFQGTLPRPDPAAPTDIRAWNFALFDTEAEGDAFWLGIQRAGGTPDPGGAFLNSENLWQVTYWLRGSPQLETDGGRDYVRELAARIVSQKRDPRDEDSEIEILAKAALRTPPAAPAPEPSEEAMRAFDEVADLETRPDAVLRPALQAAYAVDGVRASRESPPPHVEPIHIWTQMTRRAQERTSVESVVDVLEALHSMRLGASGPDPRPQLERIRALVRGVCCEPQPDDTHSFVVQNEDGDPIVEADTLAEAIEQIIGCWHEIGAELYKLRASQVPGSEPPASDPTVWQAAVEASKDTAAWREAWRAAAWPPDGIPDSIRLQRFILTLASQPPADTPGD